ncbi:MAG: PIN domain nuclease [Sedimentisphaerales bacterium]|jgi:predicted nucleic acid-binding protein
MILVDSSVWIDYFNGRVTKQTDLLNEFLGYEVIIIGDLILTEVLQGFQDDRDFDKARKLLDSLLFRQMLGRELAIRSAQNYRVLRKKGVTVRKTIDVIIATFCVENNLLLLHSDKDFRAMEEHLALKVIS